MWLGPDWTLVPYANPHYATKFKSMKNIQLIALITGAAVLASAAAVIPLAILRAPRPRLLRAPDPDIV